MGPRPGLQGPTLPRDPDPINPSPNGRRHAVRRRSPARRLTPLPSPPPVRADPRGTTPGQRRTSSPVGLYSGMSSWSAWKTMSSGRYAGAVLPPGPSPAAPPGTNLCVAGSQLYTVPSSSVNVCSSGGGVAAPCLASTSWSASSAEISAMNDPSSSPGAAASATDAASAGGRAMVAAPATTADACCTPVARVATWSAPRSLGILPRGSHALWPSLQNSV